MVTLLASLRFTVDSIYDVWRLFDLVLGCLAIGLAQFVLVRYRSANKKTRSKTRGALARHVYAIAVAHQILMLALIVEIYSRLGEGRLSSWRAPLATFAFATTLYALSQMMQYQYRRINFTPEDHQESEDRAEAAEEHAQDSDDLAVAAEGRAQDSDDQAVAAEGRARESDDLAEAAEGRAQRAESDLRAERDPGRQDLSNRG